MSNDSILRELSLSLQYLLDIIYVSKKIRGIDESLLYIYDQKLKKKSNVNSNL